MNKILCPNSTCGEQQFPEVDGFIDGTYTETCSWCFGEYTYKVEDGKAYPWELPKNVNQSYKGKGNAGGKKDA